MFSLSPSVTRGLLLFFVAALFVRCEKDEITNEATIETTMTLQTNAAMQGKLTVENAFMNVVQIDLLSKRTDGTQRTFTSLNPEDDKRIELTSSGPTPFNMDAEQGNYDPIEVTINLQPDPYTPVITPGGEGTPPTIDYSAFLENAKPSVAFIGKFNNRGQNTRVYVALNVTDRLRLTAIQLSKTSVTIVKQNRLKFSVDPSYIMQDLTTAQLENAVTFNHLGERTILIHERFNSGLYDLILDRLFEEESSVRAEMIQLGSNG